MKQAEKMENRRAMQRFFLNLVSIVKVSEEKRELKSKYQYAIAENICAGGVYLRTFQPLGLNTKVMIELFLPVQEYLFPVQKNISLIKVSGTVIRSENAGMAVKFDKEYSRSEERRVGKECDTGCNPE